MDNIMMVCGHAATVNRRMPDGHDMPCCVICCCDETAMNQPVLDGRIATCVYGGSPVESAVTLPFFKYRRDCDTDQYYCGCFGWD